MIQIDWNGVLNQFLYDAKNPLLFNNGFFMYFILAFILCYYIFRKNFMHRATVLTLFSLYFFYKASGSFVVIVIISAFFNFGISNLIFKSNKKISRQFLLFLSVVFNLGLLFYFKYTNFFIELVNSFSTAKFNFLTHFTSNWNFLFHL